VGVRLTAAGFLVASALHWCGVVTLLPPTSAPLLLWRQVTERYGAMLEQYLRNVGDYKIDLGHQMFVMSRLEQTALKVRVCGPSVDCGIRWQVPRNRLPSSSCLSFFA
jgi:hypothetical protein